MAVPLTEHAERNITCPDCRDGFIKDLRWPDGVLSIAMCTHTYYYAWLDGLARRILTGEGRRALWGRNGMAVDLAGVEQLGGWDAITGFSIGLLHDIRLECANNREFSEDISLLSGRIHDDGAERVEAERDSPF